MKSDEDVENNAVNCSRSEWDNIFYAKSSLMMINEKS